MKKAIVYLLLVFSLATVLLIGCAAMLTSPATPPSKALSFVGSPVKYAIKYYGEPVLKEGPFIDLEFLHFKHPTVDPEFGICTIIFLVDDDGIILELTTIECK